MPTFKGLLNLVLSWFRSPFTLSESSDRDDDSSEEVDRPPPIRSLPPSETPGHLVALALKRDGENGITFFPLWGSQNPSREETAELADQYDGLRPEEGYLHVLSLGLFYSSDSVHILIRTTRPDEMFTYKEAQQLGDYIFKLMRGKRGDIFLASVADSMLGKKRCFLLTSTDRGLWSIYEAKKTVVAFQVDNPEVFATDPDDAKEWRRKDLPVKVVFGGFVGFVPIRQLVTFIRRGESLLDEKALKAKNLPQTLTTPMPGKASEITRVYVQKYLARKVLSIAVYCFDDGCLHLYDQNGVFKLKKPYRGFVVTEIDDDGLPFITDLVAIARHAGRPTIVRRQPSGALDPISTPEPVPQRVSKVEK